MTDCADCKFYQAEVARLQQAILKAAMSSAPEEEDIQALRDSYLMALDDLNEHTVLAHGVRGDDGL